MSNRPPKLLPMPYQPAMLYGYPVVYAPNPIEVLKMNHRDLWYVCMTELVPMMRETKYKYLHPDYTWSSVVHLYRTKDEAETVYAGYTLLHAEDLS